MLTNTLHRTTLCLGSQKQLYGGASYVLFAKEARTLSDRGTCDGWFLEQVWHNLSPFCEQQSAHGPVNMQWEG